MTTRSAVLWAETSVGRPGGILYTCPAGFVTILKSAYATNHSGQPSNVILYVLQGTPQVIVRLVNRDMALGESAAWEGWLVLEPGNQLVLDWTLGPIATWGSGALLPAP